MSRSPRSCSPPWPSASGSKTGPASQSRGSSAQPAVTALSKSRPETTSSPSFRFRASPCPRSAGPRVKIDPVMAGYRRDIDAARRRLADCERRILRDPRFGDIEYTARGQGPSMILSHPLFGGFDMMTGFAGTYIGAGHRFVAPSRFGYLGSSLPPAAMPRTRRTRTRCSSIRSASSAPPCSGTPAEARRPSSSCSATPNAPPR
jgi:hypothetical protein